MIRSSQVMTLVARCCVHTLYRALELHKEMNENGLELPANELLEFIEVRACRFVLPLIGGRTGATMQNLLSMDQDV